MVFVYGIITLYDVLSHTLRLTLQIHVAVLTPTVFLLSVCPLPRSLATTNGISVDVFSSGYLDVSVPRVPLINLLIQLMIYDSSS